MPRKISKKAGYTQSQKLAYYKAKSARKYGGRGTYNITAPKSHAVGGEVGEAAGNALRFIPGFGGALSTLASPLTKKVGQYLGNKLGSYFGWGTYSVRSNSLAVPEGNSPAAMHSQGMVTRICHREYFGDVISSATPGLFKIDSYKMQPGAADMFPWLSDIAPNFQKYRIRGAIIEYKSGSGDAITGTNTALGEVIISTNYNNADPNFTSRNQMENTQYCSSAKPSVSMVHIIECDPSLQAQENLYTSTSTTPITGLSPNDINWCNVQVATVGCQGASVNLGSLYITYDVELIQPIEFSAIRRPYTDIFQGTTYTNALPWGGNLVRDPDSSLGGTVFSNSTYVFPSWVKDGLWNVYAYWQASVDANYTPPVLTVTNGNLQPILESDATSQLQSPATAGLASRYTLLSFVKVNSSPCTLTMGAGVISGANPLKCFIIISPLDASFNPLFTPVPRQIPEPSTMRICQDHTTTIREDYERAKLECSNVGESETVHRLREKLRQLEAQNMH